MQFYKAVSCLLFVAATHHAHAGPAAGVNIPTAIAQSDVILVGRFKYEAERPRFTHGTIRVERVILGDTTSLTGKLVPVSGGPTGTSGAFYGIFFLHRDGSALKLLDGTEQNIAPAAPPGFKIIPGALNTTQAVAAELVSVLDVPEAELANPDNGLTLPDGSITAVAAGQTAMGQNRVDWRQPTQIRLAEEVYDNVSHAVETMPIETTRPFLEKFLRSHPTGLASVWAQLTLVAAGDSRALAAIAPYALHPRPDARLTNDDIGNALDTPNALPPDQAPAAARLLNSPDADIRSGASRLLHLMRHHGALPALEHAAQTTTGPDHADAIRGICVITGTCGTAQPEAFASASATTQLIAQANAWDQAHPQ